MSALSPSELDALTHSSEMKIGVTEKEAEGERREGQGEGEESEREGEEEDPLCQSTEDEVGKMLRSTLNDLETALEESRRLLSERDRELAELKAEVEMYKMQAAREIANKTKIAKSLDESLSHVREMEELTEQWQLEVRESRQVGERQEAQLVRERGRSREQLEELRERKEETISQLTSQLLEMKKSVRGNKERSSSTPSSTAAGGDTEEGLDVMTFRFMRQAVYHFLAGIHPEDHLRSISSILKFTPQERKIVYSQFGERK